MDMYSENWENTPPLPDAEAELKKIRKDIRKRNWKIVLTSLVLVCAVLLGTVYVAVPYAESLYWNPDETTYVGRPKATRTDLLATLQAYTELFHPGWEVMRVDSVRTGFASYTLDMEMYSFAHGGTTKVAAGTLKKNELSLSQQFDLTSGKYAFGRWREPFSRHPEDIEAEFRNTLADMPEYICLEACVTFSEDISMEELLEFYRETMEVKITWVAVRTAPVSEEWIPLCGMDPFTGGLVYDGINGDYPSFNIGIFNSEGDATFLSEHFTSLLQYSADQTAKGRGVTLDEERTAFIQSALDYVNQNGVKAYGCVIQASPETLLALMDNPDIYSVHLTDGWLDVTIG